MAQNDFFQNYKLIKAKIKKRFIRRPKICEANLEFNYLAKKLSENDVHDYSAIVFLANARCENLFNNQVNEIHTLLQSGHQYFKELTTQASKGHILNKDELLASATNSYLHAIRISLQMQNFTYAGLICIELAKNLQIFKKDAEAGSYFLRALEYISDIPHLFFTTLWELLSCLIYQGEYENGYLLCGDMFTHANECMHQTETCRLDCFVKLLKETFITQLFLFMIIRPLTEMQNFNPGELFSPLKKYDLVRSFVVISEDFKVALENFAIFWVEQDLEALEMASKILSPFLTNSQEILLNRVLECCV